MKKKIITGLIGLFGAICLCMLCSEPAEGTSTNSWVLQELGWMAGLVIDAKIFNILDKKGGIGEDERARRHVLHRLPGPRTWPSAYTPNETRHH